MRLFGYLLPVLALLMLAMANVPAEAARSCAGAPAVQKASQGFLVAARSKSPAAFSRALRRHVDIRRIAFYALGRYRRKLPRSQYGRFVTLTQQYIARKLAKFSGGIRGGAVEVVRCRRNVVETRIKPRGDRVLWRMSGRRIVDVNISNMWLGQVLRDHFANLIRSTGGDMNAFLARLK